MAPLPPHPDRAPAAHGSLPEDARAYDGSASRLSRLGAAIIDIFIGVIILLPLRWFTGATNDVEHMIDPPLHDSLLWTAVGFAIWLAVNGRLLATRAQTVGKKLVGIQVVNVSDGKPASFSKLVWWRYLPTLLVTPLPYIGDVLSMVDVLFIFRQDRRCIHDHIAGTRVVEVPR